MFKVGEKVDVVAYGKKLEGTVIATDMVTSPRGLAYPIAVRHPYFCDQGEVISRFPESGVGPSVSIRKRAEKRYLNVYYGEHFPHNIKTGPWQKTKECAISTRSPGFVCLLEGELVDGKIVNVKVIDE